MGPQPMPMRGSPERASDNPDAAKIWSMQISHFRLDEVGSGTRFSPSSRGVRLDCSPGSRSASRPGTPELFFEIVAQLEEDSERRDNRIRHRIYSDAPELDAGEGDRRT